jgi:hypothetical protein
LSSNNDIAFQLSFKLEAPLPSALSRLHATFHPFMLLARGVMGLTEMPHIVHRSDLETKSMTKIAQK